MPFQDFPEAALGLWLLWCLFKDVATTFRGKRVKRQRRRGYSRREKRVPTLDKDPRYHRVTAPS